MTARPRKLETCNTLLRLAGLPRTDALGWPDTDGGALNVITGSISTYVFTVADGAPSFLLVLRAPGLLHAGTWQAVHGMIEPGEKAYEAAWREAVEEAGLTPERFFKTDYVETFYSEHTDAVHLVPAFAAYVPDASAAVISEEHVAWEWLSLDDAVASFVWPSQREAVRVIAGAVRAWPERSNSLTDLTRLVSPNP